MRVYLDHNASTPMQGAVRRAIQEAWDLVGNASSGHVFGREKRALLRHCEEVLLGAFGANSDWDVIFCAGASEANNLVVRSFDCRFVGGGEHASVMQIPDCGVLALNSSGRVEEAGLRACLESLSPPFLVSVQGANSETGILQDIAALGEIVRAYGGFLHSDMVQWVGKLPLNVADLPLSAISLSAHKFGGPAGIGALLYRKDLPLRTYVYGGGQGRGLRSGTENVPAIAGFAAACGLLSERIEKMPIIARLRDSMENRLQARLSDLHIIGADLERLPNTSCLHLSGLSADLSAMAMDLEGFAVSAGSACSYGRLKSDSALLAMGYEEQALRVSLGIETCADDVTGFVDAYCRFVENRRAA